MRSRIMIFGADGQVGRHLLETTSPLGSETLGLTHAEADICDAAAPKGRIVTTRSVSSWTIPMRCSKPAACRTQASARSNDGRGWRALTFPRRKRGCRRRDPQALDLF